MNQRHLMEKGGYLGTTGTIGSFYTYTLLFPSPSSLFYFVLISLFMRPYILFNFSTCFHLSTMKYKLPKTETFVRFLN